MLSLSDSLFLSLSRTHTHTHIMIRAIIHHMPEQDERWLCVCFRTIMMSNIARHTSLHPRPLSLPFTLSRNLGSLLHPASRSPLSDSPSLPSSPSSSRPLFRRCLLPPLAHAHPPLVLSASSKVSREVGAVATTTTAWPPPSPPCSSPSAPSRTQRHRGRRTRAWRRRARRSPPRTPPARRRRSSSWRRAPARRREVRVMVTRLPSLTLVPSPLSFAIARDRFLARSLPLRDTVNNDV